MSRRRRVVAAVMGGPSPVYYQRVLNVVPAFYLPGNEPEGSGAAVDLVHGWSFPATNVTFGANGMGDGFTALQFGGAGYLDPPEDTIDPYLNRDEYSILCWLYAAHQDCRFFSFFNGAGPPGTWAVWGARLTSNPSVVHQRLGNNATNKYAIATQSYAGAWFSVISTFSLSQDRMRIFIDGQLMAGDTGNVAAGTGLLSGYSTGNVIGAETKATNFFTGIAAHIAWFNRELSAGECLSLGVL
jgi:hypothetical protein